MQRGVVRALIVITSMMLCVAACSSDTESAVADATPPPTTAPLAPAATVEVAALGSPRQALVNVIDAWRDNDWETLGSLASRDALAVAIGASGENHEGPSLGTNSGVQIDQAWQCAQVNATCGEGLSTCSDGGATCTQEILYVGDPTAGCCATIYRLTFTATPSGYELSRLDFAGDAG